MKSWVSVMLLAVTANALELPSIEYIDNSQTYGFGLPGNTDIVRYFDCSKQSCAYPMSSLESVVESCDINENVLSNPNDAPAFDGGDAYICSAQQQPVAINEEYSYAYVSVPTTMMTGGSSSTCCRCLEIVLGVTTEAGVPKKLLAQIVNNGVARFDLQVPGAGIGDYNSCQERYAGGSYDFGDQQAGFSAAQYTVTACQSLPSILQPGCEWLFNWYDRYAVADHAVPNMTVSSLCCPPQVHFAQHCTACLPPDAQPN